VDDAIARTNGRGAVGVREKRRGDCRDSGRRANIRCEVGCGAWDEEWVVSFGYDAVEGWEAYTRALGMSIDVRLGAAYKTTRLLSICS
jgi:hypothetical protein